MPIIHNACQATITHKARPIVHFLDKATKHSFVKWKSDKAHKKADLIASTIQQSAREWKDVKVSPSSPVKGATIVSVDARIMHNPDLLNTCTHAKGIVSDSDYIATQSGAIWSLSEAPECFPTLPPSLCCWKANKLFTRILTLWYKSGSWKRWA